MSRILRQISTHFRALSMVRVALLMGRPFWAL
jgi:hypothetical protein